MTNLAIILVPIVGMILYYWLSRVDYAMKRFYVSYAQDCGWAGMVCHAVIYARSKREARKSWVDKIRAQGYSVVPIDGYHLLFQVLDKLVDLKDEEVCDYYKNNWPPGIIPKLQAIMHNEAPV